jgi:hypothetical protein
MEELDLEKKVNQQITVRGTAQNARLGAVIMISDDTPIYLEGSEEWNDDFTEREVDVTGVLRRKLLAPEATVNSQGEISHGIDGANYVLESPSWTLVAS